MSVCLIYVSLNSVCLKSDDMRTPDMRVPHICTLSVLDLMLLRESDYFIGGFSSHFSRLVLELSTADKVFFKPFFPPPCVLTLSQTLAHPFSRARAPACKPLFSRYLETGVCAAIRVIGPQLRLAGTVAPLCPASIDAELMNASVETTLLCCRILQNRDARGRCRMKARFV